MHAGDFLCLSFQQGAPSPASVVWAGLSQQGGCDEGGSAGRFRALAGPGQPGEARGPRPSALPRPASGATAAALGVPDTGHATVRGRPSSCPGMAVGLGWAFVPVLGRWLGLGVPRGVREADTGGKTSRRILSLE